MIDICVFIVTKACIDIWQWWQTSVHGIR